MTKRIISEDPIVYTIDDFLTESECDHFVSISTDKMSRALVTADQKGVESAGRTGSNCWIKHRYDKVTQGVAARISSLVGVPLTNAESFQIIHYSETQEYRPHFDSWLHDQSEKTLRNMKYGGQRMWTALCYLNNVTRGGGTQFTAIKETVQPQKGRLLVFSNTVGNTHQRHPHSKHCGMPVLEGEKYAFNLWFREAPKRTLYREVNPQYYQFEKKQTQVTPITIENPELTDTNTTQGFLEEGDYFPFIDINATKGKTKHIHNYVDTKPFAFVCVNKTRVLRPLQSQIQKWSGTFHIIVVSRNLDYRIDQAITTDNPVIHTLLEVPEVGVRIYVADTNRKITTITYQLQVETMILQIPKSIRVNVPYLLVENVLGESMIRHIRQYYQDHLDRAVTHSNQTKNRLHVFPDKVLARELDNKLSRSLFPEIRKIFYHQVKYREKYKICSYDAKTSGRFHAHRDTPHPFQHRRYAMSLLLNDDYEGGEFLLPEYGLSIKPKANCALIFPGICSHKVERVTRGSRQAIISFFCSEIKGKTLGNDMYTVTSDYFQEKGIQYSDIYPT